MTTDPAHPGGDVAPRGDDTVQVRAHTTTARAELTRNLADLSRSAEQKKADYGPDAHDLWPAHLASLDLGNPIHPHQLILTAQRAVMCAGPETSHRRFFAIPTDLPTARSGRPYPLDVWDDLNKHERPGRLRYPTMLHPAIPHRLICALTRGPDNGGTPWQDLVVDPFVGGGQTAIAAHTTQRRFLGGDINPAALTFTAARLTIGDLQ